MQEVILIFEIPKLEKGSKGQYFTNAYLPRGVNYTIYNGKANNNNNKKGQFSISKHQMQTTTQFLFTRDH